MEGHKKFSHRTVRSGYLNIKDHPKVPISQSKFPGTRKFILRYQSFEEKKGAEM